MIGLMLIVTLGATPEDPWCYALAMVSSLIVVPVLLAQLRRARLT